MNVKSNPIFLSADALTLAPGETGTPDMDALTNQNQRPMLIDEVRFSIITDVNDAVSDFGWIGSLIRAQMLCGSFEVTRDFVPVWSFARVTDSEAEANATQVFGEPFQAALFYRWMPAVPIYVPVGASIIPKLQFFKPAGLGDIDNLIVSVGYAGRELVEPIHGRIRIPYVGLFARDDMPASGFDVISNEKQLTNPFNDRILDIHRFSFRAYTGVDGDDAEEIFDITARVYDSNHNDVLPRLSQEGGAFAIAHRIWDTPNVQLGPKEWYVAEVAGSGDADTCGIALAMFGSREEVFP